MLSSCRNLLPRVQFRSFSFPRYSFVRSALICKSFATQSSVVLGSQFENETIELLRDLHMNLHGCGGPNDQGIDIQGEWQLDVYNIPILIQCKNTKVTKPQFIREFIGVMGREYLNRGIHNPYSQPSPESPFPIGMLCTSAPISNSILRESALCPYPLLLCSISKQVIQAIQPNYSLIRLYPDLQFVFDINHTNIPTILYKNNIIFERLASQ